MFFNGVVSVDEYDAVGVADSCIFQSSCGSSGRADGAGFSDAVNAH